jgi:hypothetical protein
MVSGCLLMERPWKGGMGIDLAPRTSYKPSTSNIAFQQDVQSVIQIVDRFAAKNDFKDYTKSNDPLFIKEYGKSDKQGGQQILIYYDQKKDVIHISIAANYEPSPGFNEKAMELRDNLLAEFGDVRIQWQIYKGK